LGWFIPLLALRPSGPLLLWTALVPLAYNVLIPYGVLGKWQELAGFRTLEYLPVFGLLAVAVALRARRAEPQA
jgi:hypothetical protein